MDQVPGQFRYRSLWLILLIPVIVITITIIVLIFVFTPAEVGVQCAVSLIPAIAGIVVAVLLVPECRKKLKNVGRFAGPGHRYHFIPTSSELARLDEAKEIKRKEEQRRQDEERVIQHIKFCIKAVCESQKPPHKDSMSIDFNVIRNFLEPEFSGFITTDAESGITTTGNSIDKRIRLVIIEGYAGSGKSGFMHRLAYNWANEMNDTLFGIPLQQFKLVLLLPLHRMDASKEWHDPSSGYYSDGTITLTHVKALIDSLHDQTASVLFIIDAWDNLDQETPLKRSLEQLMFGAFGQNFTFVVSTRRQLNNDTLVIKARRNNITWIKTQCKGTTEDDRAIKTFIASIGQKLHIENVDQFSNTILSQLGPLKTTPLMLWLACSNVEFWSGSHMSVYNLVKYHFDESMQLIAIGSRYPENVSTLVFDRLAWHTIQKNGLGSHLTDYMADIEKRRQNAQLSEHALDRIACQIGLLSPIFNNETHCCFVHDVFMEYCLTRILLQKTEIESVWTLILGVCKDFMLPYLCLMEFHSTQKDMNATTHEQFWLGVLDEHVYNKNFRYKGYVAEFREHFHSEVQCWKCKTVLDEHSYNELVGCSNCTEILDWHCLIHLQGMSRNNNRLGEGNSYQAPSCRSCGALATQKSFCCHECGEDLLWEVLDRQWDLGMINDRQMEMPGVTIFHLATLSDYADCLRVLFEATKLLGKDSQKAANVRDAKGWTPLMYAIRNRSLACYNLLTENGADETATDDLGYNALMLASESGWSDLIRILLDCGEPKLPAAPSVPMVAAHFRTHINATASNGISALMLAASKGRAECVDVLVQQKCAMNDKDNYGLTALHYAAQYGNADILRTLLNAGANATAVCPNKRNAMMHSAANNSDICLKILLDEKYGVDINAEDSLGYNSLTLAVRHGADKCVDVFVHRGIGDRRMVGKALIEAVGYGYRHWDPGNKCAMKLMEHENIDIVYHDADGTTALIVAAQHNNTFAVKQLLEAGAEVNHVDENGRTALMKAAQQGYVECLKALCEAHADVNVQDRNGTTALMLAIGEHQTDSVEFLVKSKYCCDVDVKDAQGFTALHHAACRHDYDTVDIFAHAGKGFGERTIDGKNALMLALLSHRKNNSCAPKLIEYYKQSNNSPEINLNVVDNDGRTALILCIIDLHTDNSAYHGEEQADLIRIKIEHIEMLLLAGADICIKDNSGNSALHYVAEFGYIGVMKKFEVATKSDPNWINILDNEERSALMIATSKKNRDCVKWLLEMQIKVGANVFVKDNLGKTYFDYVTEFNLTDTMIKLIEAAKTDPHWINIREDDGHSALMVAASQESLKCFYWLFDSGAMNEKLNENADKKVEPKNNVPINARSVMDPRYKQPHYMTERAVKFPYSAYDVYDSR